jgi:hypothetical protein
MFSNCSDLLNSLLNKPTNKLKDIKPISTSIEGDIRNYSSFFEGIPGIIFWGKDTNLSSPDGRELHITFPNHKDAFIEAFDNSKFYNHLEVYVTEDNNHIEFIASNVTDHGQTLNFLEESEYIYEPRPGVFYVYHGKTSYADNGKQLARSMNHGVFSKSKTKSKAM